LHGSFIHCSIHFQMEIFEYKPGMELGKGYDKVKADVKIGSAVKGTTSSSDDAPGNIGSYDFLLIESYRDFESALGIDTSIGGGIPGIGGSFKFQFKDKCKVTKEATFCMMCFQVLNAFETFNDDIELTDDARELLLLGNTDPDKNKRFEERFGDHFISGRYTGGEFYGSIKIEAETIEKSREVATKISASYFLFRSSFKLEDEFKETISSVRIQIHVLQSGGIITPVGDLESLFKLAIRAAEDVQRNRPTPLFVTLGDYDELDLPYVSSAQRQVQEEVLKKLGRSYRELQELQNDVDFILRNQHFYINPNISSLNNASRQIAKELNEIADRADRCMRDITKCEQYSPNIPRIDRPQRKKPTTPTRPNPMIPGRILNLKAIQIQRLENQLKALKKTATGLQNRPRLLAGIKKRIQSTETEIRKLRS
jgi:hypothetical protein